MSALERLDEAGPVVLLRGRALLEAAWLVGRGFHDLRKREGVSPWPELLQLQRDLGAAAAAERDRTQRTRPQAGIGQTGHADEADSAWCASSARWLGTGEVARMLGISQRQAQRLGPKLGVRHGRAYRFDAEAVAAYGAALEGAA